MFLSTLHSEGLAGRTETFVRYGVTPRLELGFGFLAKQGIARPLLSYTLVTENAARPSLTAGLMYDSLGGGRQGAFVSVAKNLRGKLPASLYIGGAQITNETRPRLIAGGNVGLTRWLNASVQFDGKYPNVGVTANVGSVGGLPVRFGVVAARGDKFGPLIATDVPLAR